MRGAWFSLVAVALCACGPHLNSNLRVERAFVASADCAQGPFELEVSSLGGKWGEELSLEAYGHPIRGEMQLTEGGSGVSANSFGPEAAYVRNDRCRLVASGSAGPSAVTRGVASSSVSQPGAAGEVAKAAPVELREVALPRLAPSATHIAEISFPVEHLHASALGPGAKLKVKFWSDAPNDLRGVVFVLRQHELVPSVPEAEWIAYLKKEQDDEDKERKEQEADAAAEDAKWRAHRAECERNLEQSGCDDVKATVVEEHRRSQEFEHERFCETHLGDEACADLRKERENAKLRARFEACKPHPSDPSCADLHEALHSDTPRGPPPAPLAEEQPPKPSLHAEWVPGGWTWDGWDFKWTGGGWRVPESDIRARLTVTAPSAPPPPRVEVAVAQPIAGAIWVPGAWHWNGASWVWLGGAWRMPPQVGLRWRAPSWVVSSRGVQLDPGRWVR